MDQKKKWVVDAYARYVSPGKVDMYTKYGLMLVPGKRSGCYIYDMEGGRFLNCHSNGGVFNLGHRNKRVAEAVTRAMKTYDIGNHHLVSRPKAMLAAELASVMPKNLNQVVYGVGGGEAIDLAIKLSRGVTGRPEIISARGAYHGHTGFALATGDGKFKDKFKPMAPGFKQVPFNDIDTLQKSITKKTAAVILETIPATLGIVVPHRDYFKKVKKLCEQNGTLLILDEVQTGFGRTGKFWGFENFGVEPDIVVMGKGMSGGIYPISATVYNAQYAGFFRDDPFIHISTFGGSEIGCMAAIEVIRITKEKGFLSHVVKMGRFFRENIGRIAQKYPAAGLTLRGIGLMMGLEFKDEMTSLFMLKLLFDRGLYVVYSGNDQRVLQFLPPLIVNDNDARTILRCIESALKDFSK
jgi:putrescine aminotransferase